MNRENATKLGLTVVVGLGLLGLGLVGLLGLRWFEDSKAYRLTVSGSVHGLLEDSSVEVRGVPVGQVERIRLFPEDAPSSVRVRIAVAHDVPIWKGARARLRYEGVGVSGRRYVAIEGGEPDRGRLEVGSDIPVEATMFEKVTQDVEKITRETRTLLASTSTLVASIEKAVSVIEPELVRSLIDDARSTLANLDEASREIRGFVATNRRSLRHTVEETEATAERARAIFTEAASTVDRIDRLVRRISSSVATNEDDLTSVLRNLRRASQSLATFGRRLEREPSQLLFSGSPPERELP